MTELAPITLDARTGTAHVPAEADYAATSPGWQECEYLAPGELGTGTAGYWEGEPGWVDFEYWPYTEICVILSGRVTVESTGGERWTYSSGAAFMIPAGFRGRWITEEATRKIFVGMAAPQNRAAP